MVPTLPHVLVGHHWIFACWLALTAVSAVGGWFFGRCQFVEKIPPGQETRTPLPRRSDAVVAVDSPKRQWTMRVKAATPADFPRLLEEWKTLFPDTRDGIESQQENSLRWLLAHDQGLPVAMPPSVSAFQRFSVSAFTP
jgi:hypothetical protein